VPDRVYERLRKAILDGDLLPGSRLSEDQLARQFQASRTPVREALRRLELEGLVVRTRYQGTSVLQLSPNDILDLLDVREMLEGLVARSAAKRASGADLEKLGSIFREVEAANISGEYREYLDHAMQFHDLLATMSGNEFLERLMQNMHDRIRLIGGRTILLPGRAQRALDEHRALIAALAARDPEQAEAANRARIRAIKQDVMTSLQSASWW